MPSSVSGEPNTTPFSAEQKVTCSSSSEHNSHRETRPLRAASQNAKTVPQNTMSGGHRDPSHTHAGIISQALPNKSLPLTMLYLQGLHHPDSYLSLISFYQLRQTFSSS